MNDFEKWWYEIGSGIAAMPDHDFEEHGGRIAKVAWETATEQLRKERDEARRLHCHMSAQFMYKSVELETAKHVANNKGWDCYRETP
jgi:hypothetical protein